MTLGRLGATESEARATFRTLREVRDEACRAAPLASPPRGLSMGMSDDFVAAVEEGATVVRLGTAVFERPGRARAGRPARGFPMSVRIKVEHGQDQGKTWGLKQPGVYVIGRDPGNAIRVLDMKVSKGHCEIEVNGADGVWLRDLKSTHGTQLNGQPVTRDTSLKAGDEIRLGFTALRLLSDGPSDGVATPEPSGRPTGCVGRRPSGLEATFTGTAPTGATASGGPGKPAGAAPVAATQPTANGGPTKPTAPAGGNGGGRPSGVTPAPPPPRELPPDALVGTTLARLPDPQEDRRGRHGLGLQRRAAVASTARSRSRCSPRSSSPTRAFVDQFVNEARAAGQLNHPNVVQVYDVGHVDGRHFFSMEFIHGGSLEDKIPKGGEARRGTTRSPGSSTRRTR